jgi:hypothetical protein
MRSGACSMSASPAPARDLHLTWARAQVWRAVGPLIAATVALSSTGVIEGTATSATGGVRERRGSASRRRRRIATCRTCGGALLSAERAHDWAVHELPGDLRRGGPLQSLAHVARRRGEGRERAGICRVHRCDA